MKGCTLNCKWCANPEGIHPFPIPLYTASECLKDGDCAIACPNNSIQLRDQKWSINYTQCATCINQECVTACPTDALKINGYYETVDSLYAKIQRDRNFWGSNGGVTFSGGEPLLQLKFISAILKKCFDANIHTAIETCGQIPLSHFETAIPYLDWIFFDLKHLDSSVHRLVTGHHNQLILGNAKYLAAAFDGRLIFRIPFIPYFNDDSAHLKELAELMLSFGRKEINLLPLHHWGREKYKKLQKTYSAGYDPIPTNQQLKKAQSVFTSYGIKCYIGNDTPF